MNTVKNIFLKIILWISVTILLLFFTVTTVLRIPDVQTRIVTELSDDISDLLGLSVRIGYVNLNWFDALKIEDVTIKDHYDSTLIQLDEGVINFSLTSFMRKTHRVLDKVEVNGGEINLYKHTLEEPVNFTIFIDSIKTNLIKGEGGNRFSIREATLNEVDVHYDYSGKDYLEGVFDLNHFDVENLSGSLSNFTTINDTLAFTAINLSGYENNIDLPLHHFSTDFLLCQKSLNLTRLDMQAGDSHLTDSLVFRYERMSALSNFQDSVTMHIQLVDSRIFTRDLEKFTPFFKKFNDIYTVSGTYNGNVPDFQVNNLFVRFGDRSFINGNLSFSGLPDIEETFITARFSDSDIHIADARQYVNPRFHPRIDVFTQLKINGSFNGFPNDFVADGEFISNLGLINSDINLKIRDNVTSYSGNLLMQDFNFGKFFNEEEFGKVSLEGNIRGKGLTLSDADFVLKGEVSKIGINDYDYTNIVTDARFASEFFQGSLNIDDPNLKFNADGTIDLREGANKIDVTAKLDTAVFDKIYLTKAPFSIKSSIDLDLTGLQIDSIRGRATFEDLVILTNYNKLDLTKLNLKSSLNDESYREINLQSSRLDASVTGKFSISDAYKDLLSLIYEYRLNVENNSEAIEEYYSNLPERDEDYDLNYVFNLKDINPIIQLFVPDLEVSKQFNISGRYAYGNTSIFSLYSEIDSVRFKNNQFLNNSVDVFTSKISDSTNVLAQVQVLSSNQKIGETSETDNLFTELIWNNSQVDYSFFVEQQELDSYARLLGNIYFLKDSTMFVVNPSEVQALKEKWDILPDNHITLKGKEVDFKNIGFKREDAMIRVNGQISPDPEKVLNVKIDHLNLDIFNPLITRKVDGMLTGDFSLTDYYDQRKYEINAHLDSLLLDEFYIGDITTLSFWDRVKQQFALNFNIIRSGKNILDIGGTYVPSDDFIDLELELEEAQLKIAETFVKDFFSEFQGTASGTFRARGKPFAPVLSGQGTINDGSVKVNYLNTTYAIESDVLFQDNEIGFRNLLLTDKNNSTALFNGGFFHDGYGVFRLDFEGTFTDMLALNTTSKDNSQFYGLASGTGSMTVSGYPSNLAMKVNAETSRGTRIFIPLSGESSINQEDYIQFISFTKEAEEDTTQQTIQGQTTIKGLDFELDLTINENAYAEIIFDIKAGDIIRGRGNGNINLQLNKNGEFTMYGDYVFTEGGYNFTLYNIINKEFTILPDSRISWYGDPYEGVLDISASYNQLTSIAPLLDTAFRDAPEISRRYPTSVILDLEGPLLSPEIEFDIKVTEYPNRIVYNGRDISLDTEMNAVYADWEANDQELQKQVFSLIVLKQFTEDYFNTGAGGTVGNSVSEFISNQLSYWISQVDENLEIDINLGQLSEEAYNTFQLRLSYTFLDGRLRVTRDGGFTNAQNESDIGSIVGDWSVEYALSENGNLRVKIYQRSNYYTSTSLYGDPSVFTGGFSLIYTQSFNQVKEIFNKARKSGASSAIESSTNETKPNESQGNPSGN